MFTVGGSISTAFVKNPTKTLTKAVLYLNPRLAFKGAKVLTKGTKATIKRLDKFVFSVDEVKSLRSTIKALEKIKGKNRLQTQSLKQLKEQLKIHTELKQLTTAKDFISATNNKIAKSKPIEVKKIITKLNNIDKRIKKKKIQKIKLTDKKKSELLGKFYKEKKVKLKVTKSKYKLSVKDLQKIKLLQKKVQKRINQLIDRTIMPTTRSKAKKRLKLESKA
jgi:hypothetical protein